MTVFEKIEAQQKGHEGTVAWCVGEDLKAICAADPHCAEIVAEDLENKSMSIHECAKRNQENADRFRKQSKGKCVRIPQEEEERIIREFYGLLAASAPRLSIVKSDHAKDTAAADNRLNLFDFL